MPQPRRAAHFAVRVDPAALADDLQHATAAGRTTAESAIKQHARHGLSAELLKRCDVEGRDGTQLAGCVKTYLPPPDGEWGMVFRLKLDDEARPFLAYLGFGRRHPKKASTPSVYQVAHRRLHPAV